jgi:hypothetical protein
VADTHIHPGLLTPSAAAHLQAAGAQAELTRRDLEKLFQSAPDEFPARLNAYQSATGRCSWTRQTYNAAGNRVDHPNGQAGTFTFAPAYPVGGGVMPPVAFPVNVYLRRRILTATLGPVYEFDWVCGCEQTGSGSGGGGPTTDCCPNAIPTTLTITYTRTGGSSGCLLDGDTATLTYTGVGFNGPQWVGFTTFHGTASRRTTLTCLNSSAAWDLQIAGSLGGTLTPTGTCDPLSLTLTGFQHGDCSTMGADTYDVTITE